ncbi:KilA-N domain-containing protein [Nitrosococcus wardiae]|uniref:KilA-N domain-containing protein n=2 Tax=Nitrosococcus wardiae TaxID=1814290 RepID=A0A4P7BZ89_9GAMM|nr:KilA-N domain-containing protein [Nitrosococcus wardiae]
MTKAAKAFGKEAKEWTRLPKTTGYIKELEKVGFSRLLDITKGRQGGTWAHPKLAVFSK